MNSPRPRLPPAGNSACAISHKDKKDWKRLGKTDIADKVPVKRIGKAWTDGHCGLE